MVEKIVVTKSSLLESGERLSGPVDGLVALLWEVQRPVPGDARAFPCASVGAGAGRFHRIAEPSAAAS